MECIEYFAFAGQDYRRKERSNCEEEDVRPTVRWARLRDESFPRGSHEGWDAIVDPAIHERLEGLRLYDANPDGWIMFAVTNGRHRDLDETWPLGFAEVASHRRRIVIVPASDWKAQRDRWDEIGNPYYVIGFGDERSPAEVLEELEIEGPQLEPAT